jgi:peroxin-5
VKQQENEREDKAIQALERSVELDPTYLPTWLALAISYTNDGNRQGTYNSLEQWVMRNPTYASDGWMSPPESMPFSERNAALVDRLMAMIRKNTSDDIDADLQIALAVLLNSNEVGCCLSCMR